MSIGGFGCLVNGNFGWLLLWITYLDGFDRLILLFVGLRVVLIVVLLSCCVVLWVLEVVFWVVFGVGVI